MSQSRESQGDLYTLNERLARSFYTNARYNPHFLGVTGIGFFAIFILTQLGIFGQPAPQLIYIGTITSLLAALQFPFLALARRNRGIAAHLLSSIAISIFTILLTYFWQGIVAVSILIALVAPLMTLQSGIPRRYMPWLALLVVFTIVGILF